MSVAVVADRRVVAFPGRTHGPPNDQREYTSSWTTQESGGLDNYHHNSNTNRDGIANTDTAIARQILVRFEQTVLFAEHEFV